MKPLFAITALIILFNLTARAQTADGILDDGIPVKKKESIVFKFENKKLQYDVSSLNSKTDALNLIPYTDKSYFLIRRPSVNIYLAPVNPLSLSVNSEVSERLDLVNSAANTALANITAQIGAAQKAMSQPVADKSGGNAFINKRGVEKGVAKPAAAKVSNCNAKFEGFVKDFNAIVNTLKDNKKTEIIAAFKKLKALTFNTQTETNDGLVAVEQKRQELITHFNAIDADIKKLEGLLKGFDCDDPSFKFLYLQVGAAAVKELKTEFDAQQKRLTVLTEAYKLVKAAYDVAAISNYNMMPWLIKIGTVAAKADKITDYTLKINKTGYELSDDDEVKASKTETTDTYVVSVRKFDLWVPEVSAGIVYSDISYPKFGTETDAAGNTIVADGGTHNVSKFSISTMINFNAYIPNSGILPFLQIGAGANADYPALFLGGGIKIYKSLSISIGTASPWVKQLNTLKIGDKITGTAELEKDITREFKIFNKLYGGVQIKL
jgi:hypothetical protein